MHGGALGSGGPAGKANGRYRFGMFTREVQAERRQLMELVREARDFDQMIRGSESKHARPLRRNRRRSQT